jgi:protein tyrosine phosphatase (PTP) superfamily phosphohydrolase (DUF442 family)
MSRFVLFILACLPLIASCARQTRVAAPATDAAAPVDLPGIHNLVTYAPGIVCGSAPDVPEAFDLLAGMGVRTVISVDGATPDVEAARARGLRYIHLPIGYDGMDDHRSLEIARAVRDAQAHGGVYIHCHHGKHRAAGAAGAAAVTLGHLSREQATAKMHISQTSPEYKGLFAAVSAARSGRDNELAQIDAAFPEVWKPSGLVHTMVEVDETFDRLSDVERAGWSVPAQHPDLVPLAEAGRLADLLRNMRDDAESKDQPEGFEVIRAQSAAAAQSLEDGIARGISPTELTARLKVVGASCKACHVKYRD